jgi:hypothetical protein
MNTYTNDPAQHKSKAVANTISAEKSDNGSASQFIDNRPEAILQKKIQSLISRAPATQFKRAPSIPHEHVLQPFWLRDKARTVTWVDDNLFTPGKYQETGDKRWWSQWLPAIFNKELPVYERKDQPSGKPKKVETKGSSKKEEEKKVGLSADEWLEGVTSEIRDWVEVRGGMVNEPKPWEFKGLWDARPNGYKGKWDSWQDLRNLYQKESGVAPRVIGYLPSRDESKSTRTTGTSTSAPIRQETVNQYVEWVKGRIQKAIGNYPLWTKEENLERVGCVKFGPSEEIPVRYAQAVYNAFKGMEGDVFHGGRLHVVEKNNWRSYNVTLHLKYKKDNPMTMVNMHMGVST